MFPSDDERGQGEGPEEDQGSFGAAEGGAQLNAFGTVTTFLLCGVGFYASAFMARKAARGARGELTEPSVVQRPAARALGGVPNAWLGLAYYPALAAATPFLGNPAVRIAASSAACLAAAMSLYLAYSLLFVTKMPCPYCWTSHVTNWLLAALILVQPFFAT